MAREMGGPDEQAPSPHELVVVSRRGAVATLTLNRPERHNGLTDALKTQLRDRLADVASDVSVRAVVLTGAGRSFCVGQDLVEHAEALSAEALGAEARPTEGGGSGGGVTDRRLLDTVDVHYNPIVRSLATMPKPVVAAINGTCVGAGLGFALACDLRVAASCARFGTAFTAIGLTCDSGLSATLARAVGSARASELVLLAEAFSAQEAAAWGLVGRVVAPDDFEADVAALADRLAAGPTLAYAEAKAALYQSWQPSLDDVLAAESAAQMRLGHTEDHRGAVTAFLAKTKPTFSGR
jgi:2-(1,2-epoxy-1,2-dihydrophenyl)acetyl-CoA isomerase